MNVFPAGAPSPARLFYHTPNRAGDGENGIEIYFENEADRLVYLGLGQDHEITLRGNDSDAYVTEG
jgi:hypothetical protein